MQSITLIGYLSRQVNESPPHIWPAPPTQSCLLSPARAPGLSLSSPHNLVYRAGWLVWSESKWPGLMENGMWRLMSFTQIWSTAGTNVISANPLTNSRNVRDTSKLLFPVPLPQLLCSCLLRCDGVTQGSTGPCPLIFISSELTVPCLFLAEVFSDV